MLRRNINGARGGESSPRRTDEARMGQMPNPIEAWSPQIRRLRRGESTLLRDHLKRLDADSRFQRFGAVTGDRALEDHAKRCFENDAVVFGYFVDGVPRGVGELHGLGQGRIEDGAEAAFSVEKDWRGLGVGAALLARIVEAAAQAGARTLDLSCLAHNRAMQDLVRAYEARPDRSRPLDRSVAPVWRQSFDADGFRAVMDLAPRRSPTCLGRKVA
jgi:GNAT superfamily N-acetyltransferase